MSICQGEYQRSQREQWETSSCLQNSFSCVLVNLRHFCAFGRYSTGLWRSFCPSEWGGTVACRGFLGHPKWQKAPLFRPINWTSNGMVRKLMHGLLLSFLVFLMSPKRRGAASPWLRVPCPSSGSVYLGCQVCGPGLVTWPIMSLLYKIAFSISMHASSPREVSVEN